MHNKYYLRLLFWAVIGIQGTALFAQTPGAALHLIKKTLIGGEGSWDYLTVDPLNRKLYLSHSTKVEVLNLDTYERLAEIQGDGIHGITLIPELSKGYITNGRANSVTEFDLRTYAKTKEIVVGKNPDAAVYDEYSKRLFVFNAGSKNASVIDPVSGKVLGIVKLKGAPEAGVSDGKGRIWVNLEDKSRVAVFDAKTLKVLHRFPLSPGEAPSGLAIDVKHQVLFSVCENKMMVILEANTGKILDNIPIGARTDGVIFDPELQIAVSSNGEGSLSIISSKNGATFKLENTIPTEVGTRTIALDPTTHHVFTVTAQYGERPAPTKAVPHPRPKILPGTFVVLEYGE